jgi:hypothetical protein
MGGAKRLGSETGRLTTYTFLPAIYSERVWRTMYSKGGTIILVFKEPSAEFLLQQNLGEIISPRSFSQ